MLSESTARLVAWQQLLGEPERSASEAPTNRCACVGCWRFRRSPAAVGPRAPGWLAANGRLNTVAAMLDRSVNGQGCVVALAGPAGSAKAGLCAKWRQQHGSRYRRVFDLLRIPCQRHPVPCGRRGCCARSPDSPILDHAAARARLRARFDDADDQDRALLDDLLGIRDPAWRCRTSIPTRGVGGCRR